MSSDKTMKGLFSLFIGCKWRPQASLQCHSHMVQVAMVYSPTLSIAQWDCTWCHWLFLFSQDSVVAAAAGFVAVVLQKQCWWWWLYCQ